MASEEIFTRGDEAGGNLLSEGVAQVLIQVVYKIRKLVDFAGRWASLLFVPMILITVYDVCLRKTGKLQIDIKYWAEDYGFGQIFESTLLQESEWHFHTALFSLVLGFGVIWNTQVRVDVVREHLKFRRKAWLELLGATFFMIPYMCVVCYFAAIFAYESWAIMEISASQVGLPYRYIIKTVLTLGLFVAILAGIAVWIQSFLALFAPAGTRFELMTLEWPEHEGDTIEGKDRMAVDLTVSVEEDLERQTKQILGSDDKKK
jgi:TRAP-type mannitol/chloroaromatic compound transport system permease small subunit